LRKRSKKIFCPQQADNTTLALKLFGKQPVSITGLFDCSPGVSPMKNGEQSSASQEMPYGYFRQPPAGERGQFYFKDCLQRQKNYYE
jgi:hypothetical protein